MPEPVKVELKIQKGKPSIAKGIRINGIEFPGVQSATVLYTAGGVRKVLIEAVPTDVVEVDEADWDG